MKKSVYLFGLVSVLFFLGLAEAVSGFVLWFAGRRYLGIARYTWMDVHNWAAIALTAIVIIHFITHWKWVARMTRQIFRQAAGASVPVKGASNITTDLQPSIEELKKKDLL